ncbi:unnamed protein product [Larinioides sclopetarius]|uniref:Uncharacterized protein n=1 Tax=Larinioides sclopetarius TaxID=280406 RepID=A0AAV2BQA4_9ARAC
MARRFSGGLDTPVVEIPFGHKISYLFNPEDLSDGKEFIRDIDCHDVPTSWLFEIRKRNDPEIDMTTFPVSLMRVDYMEKPVDASIEFLAYDDKGRFFSNTSTSIRKDGMLTGNVLKGTFQGTELLPQKKNRVNYQIYATFTLRILNCHSIKNEDSETKEYSMGVV